jgi:excinuclease ABC subunit A
MSLPQGQRIYLCMRLALDTEVQKAAESTGRSHKKPSARLRPEDRLAVILPGLQQQGFVRLLIDDQLVDLSQAVDALRNSGGKKARIVVDRLIQDDIRKGMGSIEACSRNSKAYQYSLIQNLQKLNTAGKQHRYSMDSSGNTFKFSEAFECQLCHVSYQEPEPRLFSFNNPFGACPECQGFGNTLTIDLDLVIPDKSKSLAEGAVNPWAKPRFRKIQNRLLQFAAGENIPVDTPWDELPDSARDKIVRAWKIPGILDS